jgi:hypothetical protein
LLNKELNKQLNEELNKNSAPNFSFFRIRAEERRFLKNNQSSNRLSSCY